MPDDLVRIHGGWIREENARAFCEVLASLVGYDFDDSDWQAVIAGLPETDDEQVGCWYDYPLIGMSTRLEVRLARTVGGSELSVEVLGPEGNGVLHAQVELACDIGAAYSLLR